MTKEEYDKQYRDSHKEEKKEYGRQYNKINKKKIKKTKRKYYLAHQKERTEYNKQYYATHKKEKKKYGQDNRKKLTKKQKELRKNNPDKIKQWKSRSKENQKIVGKKCRIKNMKKNRNTRIKKNYGITLDEVTQIIDKQEGKCAICGKHQDELNKALVIDHNHKTEKVRGLLCNKCNMGLGHFYDDIELLSQAIAYLRNNL